MAVQGIEVILVLDHHKVAVEVGKRHIDRLLIRAGKDHRSITGCIHRRAKFIYEFDPGMRIPSSMLGGTISIGGIHEGVVGKMDGALEEEVAVGDAVVGGRWVARSGCLGGKRGWGEGGRG